MGGAAGGLARRRMGSWGRPSSAAVAGEATDELRREARDELMNPAKRSRAPGHLGATANKVPVSKKNREEKQTPEFE